MSDDKKVKLSEGEALKNKDGELKLHYQY